MTVNATPAAQGDTTAAPVPAIVPAADTPAPARAPAPAAQPAAAAPGTGEQLTLLLDDAPAGGDAAPDAPPKEAPQDGQPGGDAEEGAEPEAEINLTWPEGWQEDTAAVDDLKAFAKEKNLKAEEVQRLADIHTAIMERQVAAHVERIKGWEDEVRADKDFGGANLSRTVENAKEVLRRYGSDTLRDDFRGIGYLSHPEFVKMLARIHRDVSEGRSVGGVHQTTSEKRPADVLFGGKK